MTADYLKPLLTQKIRALSKRRLTDRAAITTLIEQQRLPAGRRLEAKLALLLVNQINPHEDFSAAEEAFLRGISADTLARRRAQGRYTNGIAR